MKVKTEIKSLDELVGGLPDNKVTTVVGRIGSGRSMTLLALAVAEKKDCVVYIPRIHYNRIRSDVELIAPNMGYKIKDINWVTTSGMWLIAELPTHTIRIAGEHTEQVKSVKKLTACTTTLVESHSVQCVYLDAPYLIAKTKEDEHALMSSITKYASKTSTSIVIATRLKKDSDASSNPEIDKAIKKASGIILLTPGWPRVDGTDLKIDLKVMKDDENEANEGKTGCITLDRTVSNLLLNV